jgi:hypothetical protein
MLEGKFTEHKAITINMHNDTLNSSDPVRKVWMVDTYSGWFTVRGNGPANSKPVRATYCGQLGGRTVTSARFSTRSHLDKPKIARFFGHRLPSRAISALRYRAVFVTSAATLPIEKYSNFWQAQAPKDLPNYANYRDNFNRKNELNFNQFDKNEVSPHQKPLLRAIMFKLGRPRVQGRA